MPEQLQFHQHNGTDGSPKIDAKNVLNLSEGGKYNATVSPADFSVASATYANVTGALVTTTQTINAKRYLLLFTGGIQQTAANSASKMTFNINGVDKSDLTFYQKIYDDAGGDDIIPISMNYITDSLANGTHTFQIRIKIDTGTVNLYNMKFLCIELSI